MNDTIGSENWKCLFSIKEHLPQDPYKERVSDYSHFKDKQSKRLIYKIVSFLFLDTFNSGKVICPGCCR